MKNRNKLIRIIKECVNEPFTQIVINEITASIRIVSNLSKAIKIGQSKFGGIPDLPIGMDWIKNDFTQKAYSFLCQINLKEISKYEEANKLPKEGLLSFFFDLDSTDDGKVIYIHPQNKLYKPNVPTKFEPIKQSFFKRIFSKNPKSKLLKEAACNFSLDYSHPSANSLRIEKNKKIFDINLSALDAFQDDFFEKKYDKNDSEDIANHKLLGLYEGIQDEYQELILSDIFDNPAELTIEQINRGLEWTLLFQMDSDQDLQFNYLDSGRVYFFIKHEDLENQDFNRVKVISDCY